MRGIVGAAIVAVAGFYGAAAATAQDQGEFVRAVDRCLAANAKAEFESVADVAARIAGSCNGETGTVRLRGRGDPAFGDLLHYDAEGRRIVWQAPLTMANRFGGTYSPYDYNPVLVDKSIPKEARSELRAAWDKNYWLIPVVETDSQQDTYAAKNGFGAEVEVHRRRSVRYALAAQIPPRLATMIALLIPMDPQRAREVIDRLDVVLTWRVSPGCGMCYRANTKVTGVAPTMASPIEERIENRYIFVQIARIQVIDRTTGEVVQDAVPSTGT